MVVIASHHSDVAPQFAEWERHTKVRKTHMCSDGHELVRGSHFDPPGHWL